MRIYLKSILLLSLITFLTGLVGCVTCHDETYDYYYYSPIYVSRDSLESIVSLEPPRDLENPGAIYYKSGYVYILEKGSEVPWEENFDTNISTNLNFDKTGIHIIDNQNPVNPVSIGFLRVPGVNGMTARNDQLFADSYADLLVFDISDPELPSLSERVNNVYQNLWAYNQPFDSELGAIVGYTMEPYVGTVENCSGPFYADDEVAALATNDGIDNGVAGSMARFVTIGNYLYNIDYSDLHIFDVSGSSPEKLSDVHIGWEIETIYPHEDLLYFGASDGMYIYDNSDPSNPEMLSKYQHITSCDPVVVSGDYAYVTLRSGTECQGFTNQLDIVDISDPRSPALVKTYEMDNPHGLAVSQNCLYICEGDFGFKSFTIDSNDPTSITSNGTLSTIHAFDVIALPTHLMVVGNDGFYQYANSCGSQFEYLGVISF